MGLLDSIRLIRTQPFSKNWLPVYGYAALIFFLSSLPRGPKIPTIRIVDWVLHMIEYALFGLLLLRAFVRSKNPIKLKDAKLGDTKLDNPKPDDLRLDDLTLNRLAVLTVLIATVYGITDELHQYFVPGRMMSGFDMLANFLGSSVVVLTVLVLSKY